MQESSDKQYIVLEGLEHKNRFYSMNCPEKDQTKLFNGKTAYRILGYADTSEEALEIITQTY